MPAETIMQSPEQMVVFRLGPESYCINIFQVHEIIKLRPVTPTHGEENRVRGIINLRGKTIPVIDLSKSIGQISSPDSEDTRIIVVEGKEGNVGVVVDAVSEVVTIQPTVVDSPPPLLSQRAGDLIRGVAKTESGIITLLNLNEALAA